MSEPKEKVEKLVEKVLEEKLEEKEKEKETKEKEEPEELEIEDTEEPSVNDLLDDVDVSGEDEEKYECANCGFSSNIKFDYCPSCGIEIEKWE